MYIILFFLIIFLTISVLFFISILFFQVYYEYIEKKTKKKIEEYKDIIIEYANEANIEKREEYEKKMGLKRPSEEFVDALMEIINAFSGDFRKKIIILAEKTGVINYLYDSLLKEKNRYQRRLLLFRIAELRSMTKMEILLNNELFFIKENNIALSYFFALITVLNEWVETLSKDTIVKFMERIVSIIEYISKENIWNVKRVLDYFLNGNAPFFTYILRNEDIKKLFLYKMVNADVSMDLKGEIILIIALNREYEIFKYIKEDFYRLWEKGEPTHEEEEYIIKLVKATGELSLVEGLPILKTAAQSKNWVLKATAAKFLGNYEDALDSLKELIYDRSWWVRYNAGRSIMQFGQEGRGVLLEVFLSKDRFAKEIAASVLADSSYISETCDILATTENSEKLREAMLLINEGNNLKIVDRIIRDIRIAEKIKVRMVEEIRTLRFFEYYNSILKNILTEGKLKESVDTKIKVLFLEEK